MRPTPWSTLYPLRDAPYVALREKKTRSDSQARGAIEKGPPVGPSATPCGRCLSHIGRCAWPKLMQKLDRLWANVGRVPQELAPTRPMPGPWPSSVEFGPNFVGHTLRTSARTRSSPAKCPRFRPELRGQMLPDSGDMTLAQVRPSWAPLRRSLPRICTRVRRCGPESRTRACARTVPEHSWINRF